MSSRQFVDYSYSIRKPSSHHRSLTNVHYYERAARSQAQSQREAEDHNGARERGVPARDLRRTEHHAAGGHIPITESEQNHEDDGAGVAVEDHRQLRRPDLAEEKQRHEHHPCGRWHPRGRRGERAWQVAGQNSPGEVEEVVQQEQERHEEIVVEPLGRLAALGGLVLSQHTQT